MDSVNRCLSAIGELPVSSLDEYNVDIGNILNTINAISTTLQTNQGKGWWFNTDFNVSYALNDDNEIILPNNHLAESVKLDPSRYYNCSHYRVVVRGSKLYDAMNNTYDMTAMARDERVHLEQLVVRLEFEMLPQVAKDFITASARASFALDFETDYKRVEVLGYEVEKSFYGIQQAELRNRKHNYINDNQSMQKLISVMR